MIVPVVLGAAFGVVAAVAARSRGRSAIGWFLAGMVIGPFALVVALLPAIPRRGVSLSCPRCGEVVSAGAEVCRFCGEPIAGGRLRERDRDRDRDRDYRPRATSQAAAWPWPDDRRPLGTPRTRP